MHETPSPYPEDESAENTESFFSSAVEVSWPCTAPACGLGFVSFAQAMVFPNGDIMFKGVCTVCMDPQPVILTQAHIVQFAAQAINKHHAMSGEAKENDKHQTSKKKDEEDITGGQYL